MGWAGLIFAVRDSDDSFPDKERLCYAVRFIKHKEGVPPVIRVDEITFSNTDSVEWQDSLTAQIDQVEVSEPLKGKAVLHVEVRDKKLLVRFDDQQLNGQDTWEPKLPSWRESWSPKGSFGLGITGKGNLALISHLQVDAIESDDP